MGHRSLNVLLECPFAANLAPGVSLLEVAQGILKDTDALYQEGMEAWGSQRGFNDPGDTLAAFVDHQVPLNLWPGDVDASVAALHRAFGLNPEPLFVPRPPHNVHILKTQIAGIDYGLNAGTGPTLVVYVPVDRISTLTAYDLFAHECTHAINGFMAFRGDFAEVFDAP
jgi:hypothetical protein